MFPQTFVLWQCVPCIFRPLGNASLTDVSWIRIQRKTWMGPYAAVDYNLTSGRLQHVFLGQPNPGVDLNPMPESTLSSNQDLASDHRPHTGCMQTCIYSQKLGFPQKAHLIRQMDLRRLQSRPDLSQQNVSQSPPSVRDGSYGDVLSKGSIVQEQTHRSGTD